MNLIIPKEIYTQKTEVQLIGTGKSGWWGPHPNQYERGHRRESSGEASTTAASHKYLRRLDGQAIIGRLDRARVRGAERALKRSGYKTKIKGTTLHISSPFWGRTSIKKVGPKTKKRMTKEIHKEVAAELDKLLRAGNKNAPNIAKSMPGPTKEYITEKYE